MSGDPLAMTTAEHAAGLDLLERAFAEDLGADTPAAHGIDLTAVATSGAALRGEVIARQDGVVCGIALVVEAFRMRGVDSIKPLVPDGAVVARGTPLVAIEGDAASVLTAERTALNVLQRLSGTATLTAAHVEEVARARARAKIYDTRKTMPGMRALQRWAVRCGGGHNHRFGLFDEAMLKDNHIVACGGIVPAVAAVRAAHPGVRIHVEADTLDQVAEALTASADVVLLDNMSLDELQAAVQLVGGRIETEASGGVTLATVGAIAATGVDRISVGALTHSAPAFDAALDATV